jgi:hypothetical protein
MEKENVLECKGAKTKQQPKTVQSIVKTVAYQMNIHNSMR